MKSTTLGAQSHVKVSFEIPEYTGDITGLGVTRLLEAIRRSGITTRFYQASSSEMFGDAPPPQNEQTAFGPRSAYAAANGIFFNHESPRRGETFVSRRITGAHGSILSGRRQRPRGQFRVRDLRYELAVPV